MKENELSFEENIKKLEGIVKELETGEVPLDMAIEKFTEACSIAKICDTKLKNATDSINKILNTNGELKEFKIEE
jgi:exodeoxyribonuclease VII small subunit